MTLRFSMTPRLLGLTVFSLLALLVLMFLLGIQIGQRLAGADSASKPAASGPAANPASPPAVSSVASGAVSPLKP